MAVFYYLFIYVFIYLFIYNVKYPLLMGRRFSVALPLTHPCFCVSVLAFVNSDRRRSKRCHFNFTCLQGIINPYLTSKCKITHASSGQMVPK